MWFHSSAKTIAHPPHTFPASSFRQHKVLFHLLFSRLNRFSSLSSCSCVLCFGPDSFGLLWTLVHQCLDRTGTRELGLVPALTVSSYHCRVKGEVPQPAGCTLGDTALDVLLCHRALIWGPTQLIGTTAPLPPKCFQGSIPCPVEFELLPPRPRTVFDHLHLSLLSFLRVFSTFCRNSIPIADVLDNMKLVLGRPQWPCLHGGSSGSVDVYLFWDRHSPEQVSHNDCGTVIRCHQHQLVPKQLSVFNYGLMLPSDLRLCKVGDL